MEIKNKNGKILKVIEKSTLWKADLRGADLWEANLQGADLQGADLWEADLWKADLRGADLRGADLQEANLWKADLRGADLQGADLRGADLRGANLQEADLRETDLQGADLWRTDLSNVKNLLNPIKFIQEFETDENGIIVYKRIGITEYKLPDYWEIKPGAIIEEVVNPLPTIDCACGINFGTLKWCQENYKEADLWRCRIHWIDLISVVVPYNTDGKCRCGRLELLEKI